MSITVEHKSLSLVDELKATLGPLAVVSPAEASYASYATDWRRQFSGEALCVVRPKTTAEVAASVRICRRHDVAIVPQGGNTGLAGGAVPTDEGAQIILSLARMDAIRSIDPVGLSIEVEAGCILQRVQQAAEEAGRYFPISFAAQGSAQIGGIISSNAGGVNVLRYGMTRHWLLGLEVVLADGRIVNGLRALHKDNAGYDWKHLFIGSEGTLGIVTAAVLRLTARPKQRVTAMLAVAHPSAALGLLARVHDELGDAVNAFELVCAYSMELVERHFALPCPMGASPWYVLFEASSSLSGLREAVEATLATAFDTGEASDGVMAESDTQAAELWNLREHIAEGEHREGPSAKHDVSVPVNRVAAFIDDATETVTRTYPGALVNAFGHVGDGNIHFNVIAGPDHASASINRTVHEVVARHHGSISAEHGIGQYRVLELETCRSRNELALLASIKNAMDPGWALNPGKVLQRYGPMNGAGREEQAGADG